jgi:NUDIX domain
VSAICSTVVYSLMARNFPSFLFHFQPRVRFPQSLFLHQALLFLSWPLRWFAHVPERQGLWKTMLANPALNPAPFSHGQQVLLERRPPTGIWGGLLVPPEGDESAVNRYVRRFGCRLLNVQALAPLKHRFTHFRLTIRPPLLHR